MIDLDAIEARAYAATDGPWRRDDDLPACVVMENPPPGWARITIASINDYGPMPVSEAQATGDFIAAAREDVPALCAEVRRVTTLANENAQKAHDLADENAALRALLREAREYATQAMFDQEEDVVFVARIDAALEGT